MTLSPPPPAVLSLTCPLCHKVEETVTAAALQSGTSWACTRCGQTWSAERMETAAAYARYVATH
jgi:transposase-like protein